ncbi:IS200/IS605 family transposase, partial [Hassallia sp. VBCCA 56010]
MTKSLEPRHSNHSVGNAVVHLVWIPKRRRKVLVGE